MQTIAMAWLALDISGSAATLDLVTMLPFLPMLLLGVPVTTVAFGVATFIGVAAMVVYRARYPARESETRA